MSSAAPTTTLPEHIRAFLRPPRFATVATVGPDGDPSQAVSWYRLEPDGTILLNSLEGRRWPTDLRRSRRCSIAVVDAEDGMRWVGLSAEVEEIVEDVGRAQDDIVALAHRYHPEGPDEGMIRRFRSQQRVTFRLRPVGWHDHL